MSESAAMGGSPYDRLMNRAFADATPMNCQIEITYRCNHLCTFCYNSPSGAREMTTEQIFSVLKKARIVPAYVRKAKVINRGEVGRKLTLRGLGVTKGAREVIEKAGGKVEE